MKWIRRGQYTKIHIFKTACFKYNFAKDGDVNNRGGKATQLYELQFPTCKGSNVAASVCVGNCSRLSEDLTRRGNFVFVSNNQMVAQKCNFKILKNLVSSQQELFKTFIWKKSIWPFKKKWAMEVLHTQFICSCSHNMSPKSFGVTERLHLLCCGYR